MTSGEEQRGASDERVREREEGENGERGLRAQAGGIV